MLDLLLFALEDLKKLLKDQGSDLFIGFGSSEDVIMKIVNEVKAAQVFTEEDVDYNTRRVISIVESRLSTTLFPWGSSKIRLWRAPFYDFKDMKGMPASYNTFLKLKLPVSNPTAAPTLPILNIGLERGDLPTIDDVKSYLNNESWTFMKKISAQDILQKKHHKEVVKKEDLIGGPNNVLEISSNVTVVHKMKKSNSLFASHNGSQVKGGTDAVLNALAGYLRYLEGTGRDDWQEVHDKMGMAESRNGASFGAIFGASLYFGTISRRRIHYVAIKYEKERNAGFLSPFGYSSPTVATAIETVCSMEWYRLLAYKSLYQNEGTCSIRIWRWRGFLIQRRASSGFAWMGSRLLLLYLRLRATDILKKCYPTNPERADDWLVDEILRASYDPGVIAVLESVFNFKLPVPLNYLLDWFGGKVLFIQGVRDPLSKSKKRLSMIREYCSLATIKELDAGHCPHDELPEEVNRLLRDWIRTAELSNQMERNN
ncbi:uncharacterized protein LOC110113872 isoform X4 [Dendrobium catenatum]|uniref:uncharacterized protein LOC110113872 isoform X4 n=1 Tax=Dendrobium catenatum TaxID=906689 RepID=UPI0010A00450|nr:uncharacterized protein LOC110113872 isoform X4 [Dendrobium catenatum]